MRRVPLPPRVPGASRALVVVVVVVAATPLKKRHTRSIADSSAAKVVRKGIKVMQKNIGRRRLYDTQIVAQKTQEGDEQVNKFFGDQPKYLAPSIRMDDRTLSRVEDSRLY